MLLRKYSLKYNLALLFTVASLLLLVSPSLFAVFPGRISRTGDVLTTRSRSGGSTTAYRAQGFAFIEQTNKSCKDAIIFLGEAFGITRFSYVDYETVGAAPGGGADCGRTETTGFFAP